jgi:hypothetical protein
VTPPLPARDHHYEELDVGPGAPPTKEDTVAVEEDGAEDKFYDVQEAEGEVLIKKTKGIATLADGSKYPCVIVQKKPKKSNSLGRAERTAEKPVTNIESDTKAEHQDYTPTPMPAMKNDWLTALEPKKQTERLPKPKEIVDGVLYTSRALQEDTQIYEMGLAKFSLIEPEVFQTYDVCRQPSRPPAKEVVKATEESPMSRVGEGQVVLE